MGQGGLQQLIRPLDYGGGDVYLRRTGPLRCAADVGAARALCHQYLLRTADCLPLTRFRGFEPLPSDDPAPLYRGWGATKPGGHRGLAAWDGADHPRWLRAN